MTASMMLCIVVSAACVTLRQETISESHSGYCRDDEKSGHYKMSPRMPSLSHTGTDTVSTAGESIRPRVGDVQARAFEFNPPAMIRWYTCYKDQVGVASAWT